MKISRKLIVGNLCRLAELFVAQTVCLFKQQQDRHLKEHSCSSAREKNAISDTNLESRHVDDVRLGHTPNADVSIAQMVQPGELSSRELLGVEVLVHLHRPLQFKRDIEGRKSSLTQGPGALLEDADEVVDAHLALLLLQEGRELAVEVVRQRYVGEHTMKLVRELVSTCLLEPVDHVLLEVH